jgi:hypothetical protein
MRQVFFGGIMEESLKARRAQYFVDGDLQGTLLRRVALYWFLAIGTFAAALFATKLLWGATQDSSLAKEILQLLLPACAISLLPLPLVFRDLLRVTHRFAGPMLRIRRGINELAETGKSLPITAREGDAWPECIADFNKLVQSGDGA